MPVNDHNTVAVMAMKYPREKVDEFEFMLRFYRNDFD